VGDCCRRTSTTCSWEACKSKSEKYKFSNYLKIKFAMGICFTMDQPMQLFKISHFLVRWKTFFWFTCSSSDAFPLKTSSVFNQSSLASWEMTIGFGACRDDDVNLGIVVDIPWRNQIYLSALTSKISILFTYKCDLNSEHTFRSWFLASFNGRAHGGEVRSMM
jgi:hypothetical protein